MLHFLPLAPIHTHHIDRAREHKLRKNMTNTNKTRRASCSNRRHSIDDSNMTFQTLLQATVHCCAGYLRQNIFCDKYTYNESVAHVIEQDKAQKQMNQFVTGPPRFPLHLSKGSAPP